MRVVLDGADQDLEDTPSPSTPRASQRRRGAGSGANEVAEHEGEAEPEDRRADGVGEDGLLELPETAYVGGVAGMGARRRSRRCR